MKQSKSTLPQQNVLIATLALDSGGSNQIAAALFRCWPRTRHEVRLCVAVAECDTIKSTIVPDWTIGRLPTMRNLPAVLFSLWQMAKVIRPSVVVSHGYGLNHALVVAKLLRLVRARIIVVEHGDLDGRFEMQRAVRRRLSQCLTQFLYRRADRVVYVSELLARRALINCMGTKSSIVAIPNFINYRSFVARSQVRRTAHDPNFIGSLTRPWILWVGRLSPEKNPRFFIDVMSDYFKKKVGTALILGDGPMRSDVENDIGIRDLSASVHLLGHIPDPAWFIGQADVIVLTSLTEGRPLVLLEAMACATGIVAPDHIPGVKEMLTGYRSERRLSISDRSGWADSIAELTSLGVSHLSTAKNETALGGLNASLPDDDRMVRAYASLVDEVVGNESPS